MVRVLGVDPGLTRCGLGVVDGLPGRRLSLVAVDVVRTPAESDVAARLLSISSAPVGVGSGLLFSVTGAAR